MPTVARDDSAKASPVAHVAPLGAATCPNYRTQPAESLSWWAVCGQTVSSTQQCACRLLSMCCRTRRRWPRPSPHHR